VVLGAISILIVAGGLLAFRTGTSVHVEVGPARPGSTPATSVATTTSPPSTYGPATDGWERWQSGPLDHLSWRALAWTGRELVVWRGESGGPADQSREPTERAASYNPATRTWALLPTDPLGSGTYVTGLGTGGAWTGSEALFWAKEGMVAWRPAEGRWRTTAEPPRPHSHKGVWTGTDVLFVLDGMAYSPATDTWRELALPPEGLEGSINDDANWFARRGNTVAVVGSLAGLYDIPTDTWRTLGSPLALFPGGQGEGWDSWTASVFVLGDQILALTGTGSRTIQLDEDSGQWVERPDLDQLVSTSEGAPATVNLPNGNVVIWHGTGVLLSPSGERRLLPAPEASESWVGIYAIDDLIVGRVGNQAAGYSPAVQLHLG